MPVHAQNQSIHEMDQAHHEGSLHAPSVMDAGDGDGQHAVAQPIAVCP